MLLALAALPLRPSVSEAVSQHEVTSALGSSGQLWAVGLIFLRLASLIMLMPGFGDQAVPPRLRLGFALLLSFIAAPIVADTLPPVPNGLGDMVGQVLHEVIIGLMLGSLMRVLLYALLVTGEIMSLQTTLSFAQTANPAQAQPSTSLGTFLAMLGLVLIYATNLHHLFIRAMIDSFTIFGATKPLQIGDATTLMLQLVGKTFLLALQMAAPLIAFAAVFNIATGFVGRIMPNFPVFFAATPLSVLFGLSIMALSLGGIGMVFIDHYEDVLNVFLSKSHG